MEHLALDSSTLKSVELTKMGAKVSGNTRVVAVLSTILLLLLGGCISLVSTYDSTFDQSLNKLSEDTAKFTASAQAGGSERSVSSKEATAYYAAAYNVLDRLSQRARLTRGSVACPTNADLKAFSEQPTSTSALPEDYLKFDCREFQLYAVRYYLDQLNYGHKTGGVLNAGEARALGGIFQASIMGAIQTFVVNKP